MSDRVWHKGPPPFIGWWNASFSIDEDIWRWWDGEYWSVPATPVDSFDDISLIAKDKSYASNIEWTTYWPENARVPRVWPSGMVQK